MTSGLWLAVALVIVVLGAMAWAAVRAAQAQRVDTLEDENDLRNEARDARHDLRTDDDALDELRKRQR